MLQLLFQKEALQEAAVVALIQQINAHNSVDYLQQILVDVIEDLQERAVQRHEEQTNLSNVSGSEGQPSTVTARPLKLLREFLVGQRECQAEDYADPSTYFLLRNLASLRLPMLPIWLIRRDCQHWDLSPANQDTAPSKSENVPTGSIARKNIPL